MSWVAAAIAGAAVVGGVASSNSASQAKSAQNSATQKAVDTSNQQFYANQNALAPYRDAGTAALSRLQSLLGMGPGSSVATTGPISRDQFDSQAYLAANPDLAAKAGDAHFVADPYSHYLEYGMKDGRQGYKYADSPQSVTSSPLLAKFSSADLAADPVYNSGLQFGMDEGTKAIERHASATGGYDSGADAKAIARFANDYGSTKAADSRSRFVEDQNNIFGKLSSIAGMGQGSTNVGVSAGANNASNLSALYSSQGNANAAAAIAGGNAISGAGNNLSQYMMLQQLQGGGARSGSLQTDPNLTGSGDLGAIA